MRSPYSEHILVEMKDLEERRWHTICLHVEKSKTDGSRTENYFQARVRDYLPWAHTNTSRARYCIAAICETIDSECQPTGGAPVWTAGPNFSHAILGLVSLRYRSRADIPWPVSKSMKKGAVGNCKILQDPVTLIQMGHWIRARTHTLWEIA